MRAAQWHEKARDLVLSSRNFSPCSAALRTPFLLLLPLLLLLLLIIIIMITINIIINNNLYYELL